MPHPPDYRIGPARPGPTDPAIIELVEKAFMNNRERVKEKMRPFAVSNSEAKKLYKTYCKALYMGKRKWKHLNDTHKAAWVAVAIEAKSYEQET